MGSPRRWMMVAPRAPLVAESFEPTPPAAREALVRVAGCGLCHTDLGFLDDGVRTNLPLPITLGHEVSGVVEAAGAGAEDWVGQAVIVPAVIPCGECDLCRRGLGTICRTQKMPGNDIQGGFATHLTVPARGLCPVDETRLAAAGLELADVSVVADALTTPYQAVLQSEVGPGDLAVVVGAGGIGGYAVQVAAAMGARVVAIDVDSQRLEAISSHGADLTIDASHHDARSIREAVKAFARDVGGRETEWKIFECSGTAAGQRTAYGLLNHGATLAVVGFTRDRIELRLSNLMAFHARALGNWGCRPEHYPAALDLVLDGKVGLAPFVEQHPLDDVNRVLEAARAHALSARAILVP